MSPEIPYQMAVLLLFAAAVSITAYHRLRAAHSGERFDRREEGLLLAIVLRFSGLALGTCTLLYLIRPEALGPFSLSLVPLLRWTGASIAVGGVLLLYATLTTLGTNLTDTVSIRDSATLVTSGPYHWVRHPFYVSAALLILGVAVLAANWLIAVCGSLVMLLLVLRTPKEEQKLTDRFGDAYRRYMATTGRFIPRIGK